MRRPWGGGWFRTPARSGCQIGHPCAGRTVGLLTALFCWSIARSDLPPTPAVAASGALRTPPDVTPAGTPALERQRVDAFVRAITRYPGLSDDDSLVRWNSPICLLVAGLTALDLNLVSGRLSQISSSAGARLTRPPCRPNFIVVAMSEPDRVVDAWYARDSQLFGNATSAQIRQFVERSRSRPVRVWYNINQSRKSGTRNGHFIPSDTRAESSAFAGNAALDFSTVFEIIDTRRTEHTTLNQLADYVAMAGLTCIDQDAGLGSAPSILRLFAASEENQPAGLSRWDAAFLKALYQSDQSSRTQRFDIAARVTRDISQ